MSSAPTQRPLNDTDHDEPGQRAGATLERSYALFQLGIEARDRASLSDAAELVGRAVRLIAAGLIELGPGEAVRASDDGELIAAAIAADESGLLPAEIELHLELLDRLAERRDGVEPASEPEPQEGDDPADRFATLLDQLAAIYERLAARLRDRRADPRRRRRRRLVVVGAGLTIVLCAAGAAAHRAWLRSRHGLVGTYYRGTSSQQPAFVRRDLSLDFPWGYGSPPGLSNDRFSVRWKGELVVPEPGTYTFYLSSDDGARLYIGETLLIDRWSSPRPKAETANAIKLEAGTVPIRIDYFEGKDLAEIHLLWSFDGHLKTTIEPRYLLPPTGS